LAIAIAAFGAGLATACSSLPSLVVPPYDATAEGEPGGDGSPGPDAPGDSAVDTADRAEAAMDSSAGDSTVADGGPGDAHQQDSGSADTVQSGSDGSGGCDGGCRAYVVGDLIGGPPGGPGMLTVVTTAPLAMVGMTMIGHEPWNIALTPDGSKAYVTELGDGTVTVVDTASVAVTQTIAITAPDAGSVRGIAVAPDGRYAYVADESDHVVVQIDTTTDAPTGTRLPVASSGPYGIAFSPDGLQLWAGGPGGNGIDRFAYPSLTPLGTIAGTSGNMRADRIVFNPDMTSAYVNSVCGCCGELDTVMTGADAAGGEWGWIGAGYGLVMAPSGAVAYATSETTPAGCSVAILDGSLWVFDATKASAVPTTSVPTYDEPRGLAISADGKTLFVAGYDTSGGKPAGITAYDATSLAQVGTPLLLATQPHDIAMAR
jgi:YVTN family beta-propeller protein